MARREPEKYSLDPEEVKEAGLGPLGLRKETRLGSAGSEGGDWARTPGSEGGGWARIPESEGGGDDPCFFVITCLPLARLKTG